MSDRQKQAKAKKQNQNSLEGLLEAREGRVSRLDQIEVSVVWLTILHGSCEASGVIIDLSFVSISSVHTKLG